MSSTPCYFIVRNRVYWFNLRLPKVDRALRFSLQLTDRSTALALCHHLAFKVKQVLRMANYTKHELTRLAKAWANDYLERLNDADLAASEKVYEEGEQPFFSKVTAELHKAKLCYSGRYNAHASEIARTLLPEGTELSNDERLRFYDELNKQKVMALEAMNAKLKEGTPLPSPLHAEATTAEPKAPPVTPPAPTYMLSEVYKLYAKEKLTTGEWSRMRTENENALVLRMFIEMFGDMDIAKIDKSLARSLKEKLLEYPKDREKAKHIKDLSLAEIESSGIEYASISPKTADNRLVKLSALMNWAATNGYIASNPLDGFRIKVGRTKKDARNSFTPHDLKLVFGTEIFTDQKFKHPYYYWLPLLGLYTGARIEELCMRRVCDVKSVNGVLCLALTEDAEDQQQKNASSIRNVPIHSHLIGLGFSRYVEQRRLEGHSMLFDGLGRYSEKYSHSASKWFGRYKTKLGFGSDKVFHSFRHTLIDKLRSFAAPDYAIKELIGHADQSTTHGVYGTKDPASIKPVLERVDWSDVLVAVKPFNPENALSPLEPEVQLKAGQDG